MAKRLCLGLPDQPCSRRVDAGRGHRGARCPSCASKADLARGTARERGYNTEYEANRALILAPKWAENPEKGPGKPEKVLKTPACFNCGSEATTADHVLPRSLGGTNELSNLRPACAPCNFARGNRA